MIVLDSGERIDLVESPDDGGWYGLRHSDDAVTQTHPTKAALEAALKDNAVRWES
jgi:hypothetical protein